MKPGILNSAIAGTPVGAQVSDQRSATMTHTLPGAIKMVRYGVRNVDVLRAFAVGAFAALTVAASARTYHLVEHRLIEVGRSIAKSIQ